MKRVNGCLVILASVVWGQTTASFEVATIKPSDSTETRSRIGIAPGGGFQAHNVTVKSMLQQAYDVGDFQVSGGPGWIDTVRYDIEAKGNGPAVSQADLAKMNDSQRNQFEQQMSGRVRSLLAERFHLRVHRESKEMPIYALAIAKNGSKMGPAVPNDGTLQFGISLRSGAGGNSELTATQEPMDRFARLLSNQVGRTVIDKTGLVGNFNFKMTFALGLGDNGSDGPSIFTALEEQLGLKLESTHGPVEVLVIDGVEKPSAN
jgi:uncharacterized protein (TIGR03435 family)